MMARRNAKPATGSAQTNTPLVVDVRTSEEFYGGAFPGAINIPLDELHMRIDELGNKSREITLYCASGARSAYAQRGLMQMGFTNVKNGGGIMQMMRYR
jgi:rhodanese-related sulfurtransferase